MPALRSLRRARSIRHLMSHLRDGRFWAVQLLVLAAFGLHSILDGHIPGGAAISQPGTLVIFLVPLLYAAINFGMEGAVATATLETLFTGVDMLMDRATATASIDYLLHICAFYMVAIVVGRGVDAEREARDNYKHSEKLYRGLFASNVAPIIITGADGTIRETNDAARKALGSRGRIAASLSDVLGEDVARQLLSGAPTGRLEHIDANGMHHTLRATRGAVADRDGGELLQIVFHDVTAEKLRHQQTAIYAAHVIRGQEEERRRIAQELHDQPVQGLVQVCRLLDQLAGERGGLPGETLGIAATRSAVEATIADLREIAKGLRPPALTDLGLTACVRRLVADLHGRTGIKHAVSVNGDERRVPPDMELALFRISQEAINNVERHARAEHIDVVINFDGASVSLAVVDDGVGFGLEETPREGGHTPLGLLGIMERAELAGGHADVKSSPQKGTRVYASIPLGRKNLATA